MKTDSERAQELAESRELLKFDYGVEKSWDTSELQEEFLIESFFAPFCFGTRRSDGVKVSLQFGNFPARLYYNMQEST